MNISVQQLIGKGYGNGWFTNCDARYRIFAGARATKKTVNIGGYEPIFKILSDPNKNIVMCRQDDVNNAQSTYANLCATIIHLGLAQYFRTKSSPYEIIYKPTGQKIVFRGCNNPTAITSIKFVHGELTDIYFEEASELSSYEAFRVIDGTIRSQHAKLQITLLMNCWDKESWIYEVFWKGNLEDDYNYLETHDYMDRYIPDFDLGNGKGLYLHKSTYKINEFRATYKDESMKHLKEIALELYKVEGLGMWGNTQDATYLYFSNDLIKSQAELMQYKYVSTIIGIDIGMGNGEGKAVKNDKKHPDRVRSAMTMQLVGLTDDFSKLITLQEYFFSNENLEIKKGSPEVARDMITVIKQWIDLYYTKPDVLKGLILCYVDSADSGGFRTLLEAMAKEKSLMNIRFIASTKNRIQARVDFTNLLMVYKEYLIAENCKNLIREIKNARKAEDGRCREDIDDHSINANEYAWIPLLPRIKRYKDFKEH